MKGFVAPRLCLFTLAFAIVYSIALIGNYPLFVYYPEVGRFSLTDLGTTPELGPKMLYYGWIATGAVGGLLTAIVLPKSIATRVPANVFWLVPFIMFAAGFYREADWFLH